MIDWNEKNTMVNDGDFDYLSKSSKWDDSGNVVVESDVVLMSN